jgi:ectoine hydroxylase-related dioxygenase (phytanoyl-CoA dioxygenase family)
MTRSTPESRAAIAGDVGSLDTAHAYTGAAVGGEPAVDLSSAVAHYRAHGWARLGVLADEETLAALRTRADDVMLGRIVHEGLFFQHDSGTGRYEDLEFGRGWVGPSLSYRKIEKLERDPVFRAWIESPLVEPVVRAVVGSDVAIYRATLFTKSAAGGTDLPWHQDGGSFWGLDRDPELQIWTALDDAPVEAGCLELVEGSHLGGLATPLGGSIPRDVVERARADARKQVLPARAGEVILIHNMLWHRSGTNATGKARRGFTVAYMPASTQCVRKRRARRTFTRVFTAS